MSAWIIIGVAIVCFRADNEIVTLIALNFLGLWGLIKLLEGYR